MEARVLPSLPLKALLHRGTAGAADTTMKEIRRRDGDGVMREERVAGAEAVSSTGEDTGQRIDESRVFEG